MFVGKAGAYSRVEHLYPQKAIYWSKTFFILSREPLLKGKKTQYCWLPCTSKFWSAHFYIENILYLFYKPSYLNEEVNCTEPSLLSKGSLDWLKVFCNCWAMWITTFIDRESQMAFKDIKQDWEFSKSHKIILKSSFRSSCTFHAVVVQSSCDYHTIILWSSCIHLTIIILSVYDHQEIMLQSSQEQIMAILISSFIK